MCTYQQIRQLKEDILVPDYCYAGGGMLKPLNAWFGPIGTVTPLHHDPHHNILAQVMSLPISILINENFEDADTLFYA